MRAIRRAWLVPGAAMLAVLAGAAVTNAASLPTLRPVVLPRDHGAHPAFQVEWWYTAGTMSGPGGRSFFWFATVWAGDGFKLAKVNVVDLPADRIVLSHQCVAIGALRAGQTDIQVQGFTLDWRPAGRFGRWSVAAMGPRERTPGAQPHAHPTLRAQRHRWDRSGGLGGDLGLLLRPAAVRPGHARARWPPDRDRRPGLV